MGDVYLAGRSAFIPISSSSCLISTLVTLVQQWHNGDRLSRKLSKVEKKTTRLSQVGMEEGNHSRWQRRNNTQWLVLDDQLSAFLEKEKKHNYHIITCIPLTLSSALHRESIFITFGGLEAQGERPHTSKALWPALEERTQVAGLVLAPLLAEAKAAQRSLPALPSLSPRHVTVTTTCHCHHDTSLSQR